MIFDTFCQIAERHYPELIPFLESSHLFHYPGAAKEYLSGITAEDVARLQSSLILPFPTVALEDDSSCIILKDTEKKQVGMEKYRLFIECLPLDARLDSFRDDPKDIEARIPDLSSVKGQLVISCGKVCYHVNPLYNQPHEAPYTIEGIINWQSVVTKEKIILPWEEAHEIMHENEDEVTSAFFGNAATALEQIVYLYTPSSFIVEELPSCPIKDKAIKIPRSHQRSKFIFLSQKEARIKLNLGGTHASPEPHERRAHVRTYRHERFTNVGGQTLPVSAAWVGPREAIIGKKIYKVRVDLWEKRLSYLQKKGGDNR